MEQEIYALDNPPELDSPSFVIESQFLRHHKTGTIPNLEQYLKILNHHDWTCLLAKNPRKEFINHLKEEMIIQLDWKFILKEILGY